jgi:hypothetical protein
MIDYTHHKQIVAHVCVDVPSDDSAVWKVYDTHHI